MNTIKQKRIAEHIREILSELLLREIRDPRIQGLTVMEVKVDRELQFADIYVHSWDEDVDVEEVLQGLGRAQGFLRNHLN